MSFSDIVKEINKKLGKGTLTSLNEVHDLDFTSTGFHSVDQALGGGIIHGGVVEVFGPESSGKTTFAIAAMAAFQRSGERVVFVDAEHSFSPDWAKKIGVNLEELMISQPDSGEQALQVVDGLVRSAAVGLVVVDSVSALVPNVELEGEMGQSHVGLQARLMSQACRKLYGTTKKANTTVLFINQIRDKVGVTWGSSETTSGGRGLRFAAMQRIDIRRIASVKAQEDIIGQRVRMKVVKNKLGPPFKQCELDLRYDVGFCRVSDLLDHALAGKVITKKGAWFAFNGDNIAQGREATRQRMMEDQELFSKVQSAVIG